MSVMGISQQLTFSFRFADNPPRTSRGKEYEVDCPTLIVLAYHVFMRIVRLFWAGVQIESEGVTLVIDLLEHTAALSPFLGDPRVPLAFAPEHLDAALVTHLHPDHYDPDSLRQKLGRMQR